MSGGATIAAVSDVPAGGSLVYRVEDREGEVREAILFPLEDEVVSWLNYCRHMTHIRLDKGDGVTTRGEEIVCTNHGAMFEVDTGACTFGPCQGAVLEPVEVAVIDGHVRLDDPEYSLVGKGPIEDATGDLSSTSNLEF